MNCYWCKTELIWHGDHDGEEEDSYLIVTNLSCPQCNSWVYVYLPDPDHDDNKC